MSGTLQVIAILLCLCFSLKSQAVSDQVRCLNECDYRIYENGEEIDKKTCVTQCIAEAKAKSTPGIIGGGGTPAEGTNKGKGADDPGPSDNDGDGDGGDSGGEENITQPVACDEDFSAEISACEQELAKAGDACDENSSALSNVSNLVSQASLYISQKSASSIAESCSKMATLSKGVSAGLIAYRLYCKNSINSCISACQTTLFPRCVPSPKTDAQVSAARKALNRTRSECNSYTAKMNEAAEASQNYAAITMNAKDCASLTAGAGEKPTELCLTNPDYPGCGAQEKMDCSNPKMAQDKVCVCRANPNHSMCRSSAASNEQTISAYMADRASKQKDNKNYDLHGPNKIQQAERPQSGEDNSIDGRQGGNVNLASRLGNNSGTPQKNGKGKKPISDRSVLGGFYGGSSGDKPEAKAEAEATQKEGAGQKRKIASEGGSENLEEEKALRDLRQFLPGGAMAPRRGITGTDSFYREDGITGPNSDIWHKVKNRYQAVEPTLLP